jgi:hypothetical protein
MRRAGGSCGLGFLAVAAGVGDYLRGGLGPAGEPGEGEAYEGGDAELRRMPARIGKLQVNWILRITAMSSCQTCPKAVFTTTAKSPLVNPRVGQIRLPADGNQHERPASTAPALVHIEEIGGARPSSADPVGRRCVAIPL